MMNFIIRTAKLKDAKAITKLTAELGNNWCNTLLNGRPPIIVAKTG